MINTADFVQRLEIIMNHYALSVATFTDKVGIQRSSFSHLLSGRNKPSLEFVLKIVEVFPDIDLYWLLKGTGEFPKKKEPIEIPQNKVQEKETNIQTDLFSQKNEISLREQPESSSNEEINSVEKEIFNDDIERISIFYRDGSFRIYKPR